MDTFDFTKYVPHGLVLALAGVVAWIGRDHVNRDDARFDKVGDALGSLNNKLDTALEKQASNHAEILRLMIRKSED